MGSADRISFTVSSRDFERVQKGTIEDLEGVELDYNPFGFFGRSTKIAAPFSLLHEYHNALRELDKQFRNQKDMKWNRALEVRETQSL